MGLDADSIGRPARCARAALERQGRHGRHRPSGDYWNVLHAVPDELQELIETVVVPETWFFRHA